MTEVMLRLGSQRSLAIRKTFSLANCIKCE